MASWGDHEFMTMRDVKEREREKEERKGRKVKKVDGRRGKSE